MASRTLITITHDKETTGDLQLRYIKQQMSPKMQLTGLGNLIDELDMGNRNATVVTTIDDNNATSAAGTATLTGVVAGDQLLINGAVFQAVASGATGNQFNIGGSDTITATNLAAAIVASTSPLVMTLVTASSAVNVVTFSAVPSGITGNDYDLEARGSGAIVVSGAGAQASGTLTFNTAGAAADTLTLNGVVFTAVASGAGANQWNVGATAALSATAAATAINASVSSLVLGEVYAVASGAVLTVRATRSGIYGNLETIAGGQASITASGARMTGGTDNAVVNFTGGVNATNPLSMTVKVGQ